MRSQLTLPYVAQVIRCLGQLRSKVVSEAAIRQPHTLEELARVAALAAGEAAVEGS